LLSRYPVAAAVTPADDEGSDDCDGLPEDPAIASFAKATADDEELCTLKGILRARLRAAHLPAAHPARPYSTVLSELSITPAGVIVLNGHRMVVQKPLHSQLVRGLHAAHAGIRKTLLHARSKYYWPHMTNDIRTIIDACEACQEHRQGLPFVPTVERQATYPMEAVSIDLMEVKGVKYLVMVDRFSSYPVAKVLRSATTSAVINMLKGWFHEFGWPKAIGSDGGPQFRDEFKAFCDSKCIIHELNSSRFEGQCAALFGIIISLPFCFHFG
jgi:hypothetical protein